MIQGEDNKPIDPRLFRVDGPEGPQLEILADEHIFTSWPGADAETFIEQSAQSEERAARNIHIRNRVEGGLLVLMSSGLIAISINEVNRTGNGWYGLGVLGGVAGIGFGIHMPHGRMTNQTQQGYREYAAAIRAMSRRIYKE